VIPAVAVLHILPAMGAHMTQRGKGWLISLAVSAILWTGIVFAVKELIKIFPAW